MSEDVTLRGASGPLQVRLFGGLSIVKPDNSFVTLPTQKAKALFAMIALSGTGGVDRSLAASWLWSRGSDVQARTNLRQTLANIRKALSGEFDCIESRGSSLCVVAGTIETDIDALKLGEFDVLWAHLDSLGPFLDGIRVNEPDFLDWLGDMRASLQNQLSAALFAMAEAKLAERRHEEALQANGVLLRLDEFDEGAHRQAMRIYASSGALAKALRHYETLSESFRTELGIAPGAATQELLETLRHNAQPPRDAQAEPATLHATGLGSNPDAERKTTIQINPFLLRGDASESALGAELAEEIAIELGRFATLQVSLGEAQAPRSGTGAANSHFRYELEGGVRQSDGHIRVTVQLFDRSTRRLVWAERYERAALGAVALLDDISACVAVAIPGRVQADVAERSAGQSMDALGSHELMLRGKQLRDQLSAHAVHEARGVLELAVKRDPRNARAQMYLSDTYVIDRWLGLTDGNGARLALAHARLAVEADPADVFVQDHLGFAFLSNAMWEDGQAQIERALSKIGNEVESNAWCGFAFCLLGDHKRAEAEVLRSTIRDPLPPATFGWIRGQVFSLNGRFEEAIDELRGAASLNSLSKAFLAGAYAQIGRPVEASSALEDFIQTRRAEFTCRDMKIPRTTVQGLAGGYRAMWKRQQDWDHIALGLKTAGLTES